VDTIPIDIWTQVTVLALWDTLNFPVMVVLIFVLGRPHPISHGFAFSLGMLGTHFLGGFAFAQGGASLLREGLEGIAHLMPFVLFGVGVLLFTMGVLMKGVPERAEVEGKDHTVAGWFVIGIALTFTKLPIAAAYALAVSQITHAAPNGFWVLAGLAYYNVVAFLPFFLIWAIFFIWRTSSQRYLGEINILIRDNAARTMKWAFTVVGLFLIVNFSLWTQGIELLSV
jgi:hypothetical protein